MIAYVIYKVFGFKKNKVGKRYYDDKSIYINRAVDPSEIFWENLNVKAYTKFKYSMLIYLVMICVLGAAALVHYFINILKDSLEAQASGDRNSPTLPLNGVRFLAILVTILVVMVNFALGKIIRFMSSYQRLETYSQYHLTV